MRSSEDGCYPKYSMVYCNLVEQWWDNLEMMVFRWSGIWVKVSRMLPEKVEIYSIVIGSSKWQS